MEPYIEHDVMNKRVVVFWDECGIRFRSNIVHSGGRIVLHKHSYHHIAMCTAGWFDATVVAPDGTVDTFQVASKDHRTNDLEFEPRGYKVLIPAGHEHTFTLRDGDIGEILCMWPIGHDGVA